MNVVPEFAWWFVAVSVLGAINPVVGLLVLAAGIIRLGVYEAGRR